MTDDDVAVEEPLEIRVRGKAVSVTMRTPGHDDELAAGFLLTEGIVASPDDIARIDHSARSNEANVINVFLAPQVEVDFKKLTRHVFASSSCGLCGKASIDAVHLLFDPIAGDAMVKADTIIGLPETLRAAQATFDRTGGLHAAGLFNRDGGLHVLREDIGRHNAVDKVIGHAMLNGLTADDGSILVVSGRASFEIMQKALAGRIGMVVAVSAPSSLAVTFADESNQTLIGFVRDERLNVYTHPQRVDFGDG